MNKNDCIILNEMSFYGYHGLLPAEKELGQNFLVTLELFLDLKKAGLTDEVKETVNYVDIYQTVKKVVEGPPFNLLEALAETIAHKVLQFPLQKVTVEVKKPSPPIPGQLSNITVVITRGE